MHSLHYSAWDELSFYEDHQGEILPHIEGNLRTRPLGREIRTEGLEHTPLSEEQIRAALGAFPESCDQRTRLVRVLGRSSAQAGLKQDSSRTAAHTPLFLHMKSLIRGRGLNSI
ncbi:MAG TPA: hypothetical protein VJB10_02700 [Candidatus Peribacteraceae bacterium]|nr:hypothetical protein [Candidatus Peribacteraceae bacterium]